MYIDIMTIIHKRGIAMSDFDQTKYINTYIKDTYDTVKVQFPKGYKEKLKQRAKESGYDSMSGYIKALVDADMNK